MTSTVSQQHVNSADRQYFEAAAFDFSNPSSADLRTLFVDARTAVRFSDEPVDPSVVQAIYDSAKFGPTAMNTVPLRLTFAQSAEARSALVSLMNEGNREKSRHAPLLAIVSAHVDWHETLRRTAPHMESPETRFTDEEARRRAARLNGALQMAYTIIAARAHGLDAAPMGGFDAEGVAARFFPAGRDEVLAVLALGYRDRTADRPRAPRLPYEEVVRFV